VEATLQSATDNINSVIYLKQAQWTHLQFENLSIISLTFVLIFEYQLTGCHSWSNIYMSVKHQCTMGKLSWKLKYYCTSELFVVSLVVLSVVVAVVVVLVWKLIGFMLVGDLQMMFHWKVANSSSSILAFIFHVAMMILLGFNLLFGIS